MTAQKGKDLLIKIADGVGYTTVAGLRMRRLAFNAETVALARTARWGGLKRAAVSGRGLFKDATTDALMRQTFFDGGIAGYQIVIPSFGTVQGPFQITSLEFAGEHNGEVTYDMALESAGELTSAADTWARLVLTSDPSCREQARRSPVRTNRSGVRSCSRTSPCDHRCRQAQWPRPACAGRTSGRRYLERPDRVDA